MSDNAQLVDDLFEINMRICRNLWNLCDANGKPHGLSPRLIFPKGRDGKVRISEQEPKVLCCDILNRLSYYYSVEPQTEKTYQQTGRDPQVAWPDLTLYRFDGKSFRRLVNIEFKHGNRLNSIKTGIEKLVKEQYLGNWFHTLGNTNRRTFPNVFDKFRTTFRSYSQAFSDKNISIVFCFCVVKKQHSYMHHFFYDPSRNKYEDYVTDFFDSSKLEEDWNYYSREVVFTQGAKDRNANSKPGQEQQLHALNTERPRWEKASPLENCFDLQLKNPKALDVDHCRQLFEAVEAEDGIWPPHFNQDATKEFRRWLSNLNSPLQEQAYARLSNWFLTDRDFCRNSPLGQATFELWNTLFCATPEIRLTDPRKGYKILSERFAVWWSKQLECQGRQ